MFITYKYQYGSTLDKKKLTEMDVVHRTNIKLNRKREKDREIERRG